MQSSKIKMPRAKKTHGDYLESICLFCWKKGDQLLPRIHAGNPQEKSNVIVYIEEELIPSFLENSLFLPGSCCRNCRRIVSQNMDLNFKGMYFFLFISTEYLNSSH